MEIAITSIGRNVLKEIDVNKLYNTPIASEDVAVLILTDNFDKIRC